MVFVTGVGHAAAIQLLEPELSATILPSAAVPEDRVIAADPASLIHLASGAPDIDSSNEALLHFSDTPGQVGTAGSPNAVAAPAGSLFQTDVIAVRLTADVAFGARRAGAVAYMDGVQW